MGDAEFDASVGLLDAVAIQVGIVIGAGLFSVTGVAVGFAGPGVAVSYVIAFAVVALSLLPTAVLGSLYPTVGGNYRYPSRLWSPKLAFLATWGMAVSVLGGGLPLYGLSFGQYAATVWTVDPRLVGLAVVTVFFLVNLVGIELAAGVQKLMLVSLLVSLVLFVGFGVPTVEPANFAPVFPTGAAGVLTGGALLYFVCMGANFIVDVGGEMRDAALTIPRSFLISIPLILVLYVLTSVVAVGTVGWRTMADATLSVPAAAALSPELTTFFTVGGGLFAIATTINAVYMIAPKYLVVLADDEVLPPRVGAVNERFGTAHWGLVIVYGVSVAFLVSPFSLEGFSTLMGFGSIFLVVPVMGAAIALVRNRPDEYAAAPFHVAPRLLVGVAGAAVVLNVALLALLATESTTTFRVWVGLLAVGVGYYAARSWYLGREGAPLAERMDGEL
jgi:APA family basic amino acid/polyamine antiporter